MSEPNVELYNELADEITTRDDEGRFVPVEDAAKRVTARLLANKRSPNLPSIVRGYFEVAFAFDKAGAKDASEAVIVGIAEAQPQLPRLTRESLEAIQNESRNLVGAEGARRAPTHDSEAPDGSLKLSSFLDPGRPPRRR